MLLESTTSPEGKRLYKTPEGKLYPSVTTVLSQHTAKHIHDWRRRVGATKANEISRVASSKGTSVHNAIENLLRNKPTKPISPLNIGAVRQLYKYLKDNVEEIYALEETLYSDRLRMAGKTDLIARLKGGDNVVIDFKTSAKQKTPEQCQHYFMQGAAYGVMFKERMDITCKGSIILMPVSNTSVLQEFHVSILDYLPPLIEYRRKYDEKINFNTSSNSIIN